MARPKRNATERERDLARVADLYCRGHSQLAIGQALGVSRQQISYDVRVLHKRWQESACSKVEERKATELARIDHPEAVAWTAWERSCENAEINTASLVQGRTHKDGAPL